MTQLNPCSYCGGSCVVESAVGRDHDTHEPLDLWLCANSHILGGDCPHKRGYLSAEAWNEAHKPSGELTDPIAKPVRWEGGPCPVKPTTRVFVMRRDGATRRGPAGWYDWSHTDEQSDIISYLELPMELGRNERG